MIPCGRYPSIGRSDLEVVIVGSSHRSQPRGCGGPPDTKKKVFIARFSSSARYGTDLVCIDVLLV
jgi:hypothetical protein